MLGGQDVRVDFERVESSPGDGLFDRFQNFAVGPFHVTHESIQERINRFSGVTLVSVKRVAVFATRASSSTGFAPFIASSRPPGLTK